MEASTINENSSTVTDHVKEHVLNHGGRDSNPEIDGEEEDEEHVRGILQVISSTGNFWKLLQYL